MSNLVKLNENLTEIQLKAICQHHKLVTTSNSTRYLISAIKEHCRKSDIRMEDGEYLIDLSKFECISNQGSIPNLEEAEQEDDNASLNSLGEGGYQNQTLQRSSSKFVHNLQADSVRQMLEIQVL